MDFNWIELTWIGISLDKSLAHRCDARARCALRCLQVGLVGYPNVGKSSTINALFGAKKTAVAPTPGETPWPTACARPWAGPHQATWPAPSLRGPARLECP